MTLSIITFSITTLSIATLSIATLSIMAFSIMTFSITTLVTKGLKVTLSITTLSLYWMSCWASWFIYCYAECHYTECHYSECHYTECRNAEFRDVASILVSFWLAEEIFIIFFSFFMKIKHKKELSLSSLFPSPMQNTKSWHAIGISIGSLVILKDVWATAISNWHITKAPSTNL